MTSAIINVFADNSSNAADNFEISSPYNFKHTHHVQVKVLTLISYFPLKIRFSSGGSSLFDWFLRAAIAHAPSIKGVWNHKRRNKSKPSSSTRCSHLPHGRTWYNIQKKVYFCQLITLGFLPSSSAEEAAAIEIQSSKANKQGKASEN